MITRRKPLRSSAPLKRTPLRNRSTCARERAAAWARITREVIAANNGLCAVDGPLCGWGATEGHHKRLRSQGGQDTHANCLPVCSRCHKWLHEHPKAASDAGFIVAREAVTPP